MSEADESRPWAECVTELRAQNQLLRELHDTQREQLRQIGALEERVAGSLGTVDGRLTLEARMDGGFAAVLSALQAIADRLDGPSGR